LASSQGLTLGRLCQRTPALIELALLRREMVWDRDLKCDVEGASPFATEVRKTLAAHVEYRARLSSGWNLDAHVSVERRDLRRRALGRVDDRNCGSVPEI
jgi:hypothetical protein